MKDSQRPQKLEHRSRSTSRAPSSKSYNAGASRRYAPNESRLRKPPFSPTVEDVGIDGDGVQMRGKPDQTPMLIQIADDSSSTETDGPLTPQDSLVDGQNEHKHIHGNDAKRHNDPTLSQSRKTSPSINVPQPNDNCRGRRETLAVDTELARSASTGGVPPPGYERARSPYSFNPARNFTAKESRTPREYVLTPETMSPKVRDFVGQVKTNPKRPARPSIDRRASAMPHLGGPTSASAARSRYVENSSDESDQEYAKMRFGSGQFTTDAMPTSSASYFDTPHVNDRQFSLKHANSPPRTPLSPEHTRGTFLNRDTLLNGPGLQHLSTLLEEQHSDRRRASPRPSPQPSPTVSPTASPHASPPRTPPGAHLSRSSTIESLKRYSPSSKPSSPLSSRPSSPKSAAQTFSARPVDHDDAPRPPPLRANQTPAWNSARLPKADSLLSPQIDVRSPLPAPPRHDKSYSYDKSEPRYQTSRQTSYSPNSTSGAPALEPLRQHQRQRSASNAELRRELPPLSTKAPELHQIPNAPVSPGLKTGTGSYTPAPSSGMLGANLFETGSTSGRSRSTAPGSSSHHRHRSRSRTASDVRSVPRSKSTAPLPLIPTSDQTQPVMLPQCPRPEPVAGYNDWYTIDRCSPMAVCPDCRNNIFGSGYERAFQPLAEVRNQKIHCSLNDPWIRLACLLTFSKQRKDTRLLGHLADVSHEEPPCPENRPSDNRIWYHLRDSDTSQDFQDFQVCSHCVYSLEAIYPNLGPEFHRSRDLKKEPRVCGLRSDVHRLGKYLNHLVAMADEANRTNSKPTTSDFIWEVKWMTVISSCKGDKVHYGEDWHSHPDLPELTICQECYYKVVRPVIKQNRSSSRLAAKITPEAKEIIGGASCKLYSPRMKQIFETACREKDFESLQKAVRKRNDLQQDLLEAEMVYHKHANDRKAREDFAWLQEKWRKLERKHD